MIGNRAVEATVVLGSAGRRLYLVDWFRAAFESLGVDGRVIVSESDSTSAAYSTGDISWRLPRYSAPEYREELLRLVDLHKPLAYVSLNDYELLTLSRGLSKELNARGVIVPGVSPSWMRIASDKLSMYRKLCDLGVPSPRTVLGSDDQGVNSIRDEGSLVVVKHRFGSASSGLRIVGSEDVLDAVSASAKDAPLVGKIDASAGVVVQKFESGIEHGVDVVSSLTEPGSFRAALARKKLRMRAGETDKAVTVAADPFTAIASRISSDAELRGLMDLDVMLDRDGNVSVIDINPRFGGGYPFMHLAGADVPVMYLQELLGMRVDVSGLSYSESVVSAKFEGIRITQSGPEVQ